MNDMQSARLEEAAYGHSLLAVCGTVSLMNCVVLSHARAGAFVLCARLLCLSVAQNCEPKRPDT
jgi:hypothetical protein